MLDSYLGVKCTKEERDKIQYLTSILKKDKNERVAEVIIRALEKIKNGSKVND